MKHNTAGKESEIKMKQLMLTITAILCFLTVISISLAANDPGHDTLYIEEQGDSSLNGTLNITQNLSVDRTERVGNLTIYGDGSTTSTTFISADGSGNFFIDGQGDIKIKWNIPGDMVYIGQSTSTPTDLNISGDLYVRGDSITVSGVNVCLANGSNCPISLGGANITGNGATTGYIVQFQNASTLNNSVIYQNGTNVGIGTTSPATKLEIAGGGLTMGTGQVIGWRYSGGDPGPYQYITSDGAVLGYYSGSYTSSQTVDVHSFFTYNSGWVERLSILNSGNVGIGMTSPTAKLHVNGSINVTTGNDICIEGTGKCLSATSTSSDASSRVLNTTYDAGQTAQNNTINAKALPGTCTGNNVVQNTTTGGVQCVAVLTGSTETDPVWAANYSARTGTGNIVYSASPTLTGNVILPGGSWNSTGNVGIGTTDPAVKLDVSGTIRNNDPMFIQNDVYIKKEGFISVGGSSAGKWYKLMNISTGTESTYKTIGYKINVKYYSPDADSGYNAEITSNLRVHDTTRTIGWIWQSEGVGANLKFQKYPDTNTFELYAYSPHTWGMFETTVEWSGEGASYSIVTPTLITDSQEISNPDQGTAITQSGNILFPSGNVGIGMTSPTAKLHVNGSINVTTGNDICIEGTGKCLSATGAGSMTSFTLAGSSGSGQTISNGDTLTIEAGAGITTTGAATDKVTVAVAADSIGDTQLAYNTGQHLTTSSSPTFAGLTSTGTIRASSNTVLGGQTTNGDSHYQWEGATYRNPGDHTPSLLVRADNPTTGINGFRPALTLYNFNGSLNSTVGLVFASNEEAGVGNTVELSGIMGIKESAGTNGGWSQGGMAFFVKNMGTRVDAMYIKNDGSVGIGTVSPSSTLEVNGNVELTNLYDNDGSNFFDGGSCTYGIANIDSTGTVTCASQQAGTGDVTGPSSSTDNAITRFDSTTGKIIQNSGITIDDSNNIAGAATISATSFSGAGTGLTGTASSLTAGAISGQGTLATANAVSGGTGGTITDSTITAADLASGDFSSKITSGTYSISISGSAGSATNADTVDSKHAADLTTAGYRYSTTLYGTPGDIPWRTTATSPQTMHYVYGPFAYATPSCPSGYTRYFRLYSEFVDSITSGGQAVYLRIDFDSGTDLDFNMGSTWGGSPGYRTYESALFTETNTAHAYIQVWISGTAGPYVELRKAELRMYCLA